MTQLKSLNIKECNGITHHAVIHLQNPHFSSNLIKLNLKNIYFGSNILKVFESLFKFKNL